MRLLFDENLSSRLVGALADQFPDSSHVNLVGLGGSTDQQIWVYAREHGFAVISKDDDFRSLSLVNGAPPKVIWLRIGNASTAGIEAFIRSALVKIRTFEISPEESLLVLSYLKPILSGQCPDPLSAGSPAPRSKSAT